MGRTEGGTAGPPADRPCPLGLTQAWAASQVTLKCPSAWRWAPADVFLRVMTDEEAGLVYEHRTHTRDTHIFFPSFGLHDGLSHIFFTWTEKLTTKVNMSINAMQTSRLKALKIHICSSSCGALLEEHNNTHLSERLQKLQQFATFWKERKKKASTQQH